MNVDKSPNQSPKTSPVKERPTRERKAAVQYTVTTGTKKAKSPMKAGKGVKLGEQAFWKKTSEDDLVLVHRVILGRPGAKGERKANLKDFSGTSDDLAKKIGISDLVAIKAPMRAFGLALSGTKEEVTKRLAEYLAAPTARGKEAPTSPPAKRQKKPSPAKKAAAPAKRGKAGDETSAPKRVKTNSVAAVKKAEAATIPDDNELWAWVASHVKGQSVKELENIKIKTLRLAAEEHFGLAEGDLTGKKDVLMKGVEAASAAAAVAATAITMAKLDLFRMFEGQFPMSTIEDTLQRCGMDKERAADELLRSAPR